MLTDLAVSILTRLLAALTAQTARDVLAAALYVCHGLNTPFNAFEDANAFMAELRRRHADEANAAFEADRRRP